MGQEVLIKSWDNGKLECTCSSCSRLNNAFGCPPQGEIKGVPTKCTGVTTYLCPNYHKKTKQ